ncbi:MAG: cell wall-binding protein, partial [Betaproteobacteria bacterium]|nr:cell wall-binding protein [Betaproteobacteria bacterium]
TQADLKALGSIATVTAGLTSHQFIAVGANGSILSSPDAITWSAQSANTKANFNALSTANQFLAVGSGGTIVTSLDGINWKSQTSPSTANLTYLLRAQNTYIAVNSSGGIIYSK